MDFFFLPSNYLESLTGPRKHLFNHDCSGEIERWLEEGSFHLLNPASDEAVEKNLHSSVLTVLLVRLDVGAP